jgi:UDP-GlcNAc:undecaprenyl-phosphate/decaprenyl-phosphate GlcNAc-1-phosphate transferase
VSWLAAVAFASSLALSWLFTFVTLRAAPVLGLMDHPDQRKDHRKPVPKGGGLAICAALLLSLSGSLLAGAPVSGVVWIEVLGLVLVVVGLVDDFRPVAWQVRLGVQMLLATAIVIGPLAGVDGWVRCLAWLWIVGLTNAFNMLDNMDALSGGVAFITAGFLAVATAMRSPQEAVEGAALVPHLAFMGAVLGFLWFNRPPARIFMGDAGSTYLGFVLAVRALGIGPRADESPALWLAPVCIFAVPCYDLLSVVLLRLWQRRSPFQADRQHLSHRLVQRGLGSTTAVRVIYLFANASGCSGLIILAAPTAGVAGLVVLQLALWWGALAVIEWWTRRPAGDQTPSTKTATITPDEEKRVG